ncbi:MAG TPA: NDP-sugar synthase [Solirubrobacteraceae bacterium]|nr:NDP-sugar synthase [Solirubrobacteraceae bacterium]
MQALILAGGEGTRLRPLTATVPKPVVPLVDRPFIAYMIEWLRGHGIDDVILACGFMADGVREVLGDGAALGVRLRYIEEPSPLGTGGALKYAEDLLDERFFMLNGDVLSDMDLTAQLRQHEETGARATLALIAVDDPSSYGLVRLDDDRTVREFVEKPSPEEGATHLINAGAYILQRDVLAGMAPAGTKVSIEREVFPTLVGNGLHGYEARGYWKDIGTPERYLEATFEILEGDVTTEVGRQVADAGGVLRRGGNEAGVVHGPALLDLDCNLAADAVVGSRSVLGRGVTVGRGAHIESSVVLDGASVGAGSRITSSIIGPGVSIGEGCRVEGRVVLGQGVSVGAGNTLREGMRIFPGVQLPDGAIAF